MRFRSQVLASALLLLAVGAGAPSTGEAKPPDPAPTCGQKGRVPFSKDAVLADAGGRRIARFSGGESAVTLLAPPVSGSDLARIETGTGRGSFRLQGFVKAEELRLYTTYNVPIVSSHVWFSVGTRVVAAGTTGGKVRIERQLSTPFNQRFSAVADCSWLTFNPPPAPGSSMPGNARVFLMKVDLLDLYASVPPTGAPITTLQRAPQVDNVRFFSTEQRGGFVHVQYQGEINVDAWARASDLVALPRGETSDLPPSSYTMTTPPQLQLQTTPRVVTATREVPVRVAARDGEAPIGVVEPDTEVYVMDTVAGWANVLPKSLHVLPADNLSFWVKASDLGL